MNTQETNSMRPTERLLREKLEGAFKPTLMVLENESPMHGLSLDAEKHFRLVIVSESFEGSTRVARHRRVHDLLLEELKTLVHALSVQAYTAAEWEERSARLAHAAHASPQCLGGGKRA